MEWGAIRALLSSTVAELTGIRPANVVWNASFGAGSMTVDQQAVLAVTSITTVGVDEEVREDKGINQQVVTRVGQRQFTLSIRIASQSQDADRSARYLADKLRVRLQRVGIVERFADAGIAVSSFGKTQQFDDFASGRIVSISSLDVFMLGQEVDIDDTIDAGDFISEVQVASDTIKDAPGNDTATQVALDVVAP